MLARTARGTSDPAGPLDPVLPALDGASVAGIVPALLGGRDGDWLPEIVRDAPTRSCCSCSTGSAGTRSQEHAAPAARPRRRWPAARSRPWSPSTTATALTSIATGLAPAQHGIARLPDARRRRGAQRAALVGHGRAAARTRSTCSATPRSSAARSRSSRKSEFRNTGFTQAHLRGARFVGWHTDVGARRALRPPGRSRRAVRVRVLPGRRHRRARVRAARRRLRARARGSPIGSSATSLDVVAARRGVARHRGPRAGAPRTRRLDRPRRVGAARRRDGGRRRGSATCTRGKGAAKELASAAAELVGDHAWVWYARASCSTTAGSARARPAAFPGRLGDVVLAARDASAFVDPALPIEVRLRSAHGSLTADEMYVPLVAAAAG